MLLKRLTETNGLSGNEKEVRNLIIEEIKDYVDDIEVDRIGNIIAHKKGKVDAPKVMVAAHMDEVGLIVTGIQESGLIKFTAVGGLDQRILVSKTVKIGKDNIPGVIGAKPIHLQKKGERKKALQMNQLYIDIGVDNKKQAEKVVKIGDYIAFDSNYVEFGKDLVKAKGLDDRVGCGALIELLKSDTNISIHAAFTVMEEVGLVGAGPAGYTIDPDIAIILEGTTCSDVPDVDSHLLATELGKGPAISLMDRTTYFNKNFRDIIVEVAKENNIPYQFRRTTFGGNDSGKIHMAKEGAISATISVPCRYIHSPVSVMNKNDYENAKKLLKAIIERIEKGGIC
ncbi:M42 family metallopeptidase [Dethiothermospora halolimnae]|uniref:M42 family metallopeptidase n=1 Tax=Dethiothermospora halolimnae TaxID=3114390 RepID=UPI003CCBF239